MDIIKFVGEYLCIVRDFEIFLLYEFVRLSSLRYLYIVCDILKRIRVDNNYGGYC